MADDTHETLEFSAPFATALDDATRWFEDAGRSSSQIIRQFMTVQALEPWSGEASRLTMADLTSETLQHAALGVRAVQKLIDAAVAEPPIKLNRGRQATRSQVGVVASIRRAELPRKFTVDIAPSEQQRALTITDFRHNDGAGRIPANQVKVPAHAAAKEESIVLELMGIPNQADAGVYRAELNGDQVVIAQVYIRILD